MAYSAMAVANEIIAAHGADGQIDPLKLQKLLYFANGWWLAFHEEPLIVEAPQVWRYGPVFRSIYHAFSRFGRNPVTEPLPATPFGGAPPRVPPEHREVRQLIDWIWDEYGHRDVAPRF